mmetsp:Transcript_11254/g.15458  ORF Transcript_11254/g.15458 Transcript_11254/m.15458 type:complete len:303 (+) Transcript_11254:157-1065(+)
MNTSPLLQEELLRGEPDVANEKKAGKIKALRIVIDEEGRHIDIALLPGADSIAMQQAVSSALREMLIPGDSWWLVDGESEGLVVPLCSAIPGGSMLALRTSSGNVRSNKELVPARGRTSSLSTHVIRRDDYLQEESPTIRPPENKSVSRSLRRSWVQLREALNFISSNHQQGGDQLERSLVDVNRMAKVTTELANERTLLAWCRTALAVERTVFSFLSYKDTDGVWKHIYFFATALLASYAIFIGYLGAQRYYRIKSALLQPNRHASVHLGRLSVQPAILILATILSFVALSIYGHHIFKAS